MKIYKKHIIASLNDNFELTSDSTIDDVVDYLYLALRKVPVGKVGSASYVLFGDEAANFKNVRAIANAIVELATTHSRRIDTGYPFIDNVLADAYNLGII